MALQVFILLCSTQWQKRLATTIPDIFPVPKGKNVICQIKVCYAAININPGKWSGLPPKKSRDHTCPGKHNEETTVSPRLEEGAEMSGCIKKHPHYYLFITILGRAGPLLLCTGSSLVVASGGYSQVALWGPLAAAASPVWSMGSRHPGFVAAGL